MRHLSPRRTDEQWFNLVLECRQSGLSDRAWCTSKGIAPNTFYYHIKDLQEKAFDLPESISMSQPQTHEIVAIDLNEVVDYREPIEASTPSTISRDNENDSVAVILDFNGINLKILNNASDIVISNTIKALRNLC